MKKYLFIIAALLLFFGCIKPPTVYVTVSGNLYKDCGGQPLAGKVVALYERSGGGFSGGSTELGYDTTDANGYFELRVPRRGTAKAAEGGYGLDSYNLGMWPSIFLMTGVLLYDNLSGLKVYQTPTCSIKVGLNVINPYTSTDTLFVHNLYDTSPSGNLKIPGPFSSGVLYEAPYNILTPGYYLKDSMYLSCKLNNGPWKLKYVQVKPCETSELFFDIN